MSIIERLRDRDICDGDLEDAADMLEFFFGQMQMYSADMGGRHRYRFRGGWPMNQCVGPNAEEAVMAAIDAIKQSRDKAVRLDATD